MELLNDTAALATVRAISRSLQQRGDPHIKEWQILLAVAKSGIQDSRLVGLRLLALRTARKLLNAKGIWHVKAAESLLKEWQSWARQWPIVMDGTEEALEQMRYTLEQLVEERRFKTSLQACTRPLGQVHAEQRIRSSLGLASEVAVDDYCVRWAVLTALLTPLRQSVGSCFATAPGILVQRQEPMGLLEDLRDLIDTGRIERIASGEQAMVPIALRWASGTVLRPIRLERRQLLLNPSILAALRAAGLVAGDSTEALAQLKKHLARLELKGDEAVRLDQLWERLVAREMGLPWPMPTADQYAAGMLLTAQETRIVSQRQQWEQRTSMAVEAFAAWEHDPLLKTWEYSLASFVEARPALMPQNLWTALGLSDSTSGSFGFAIRECLQPALDEVQQEIEIAVQLADQAVARWNSVKGRSSSLSSPRAVEWAASDARSAQRDHEYASGRVSQLQEQAEQITSLPQLFARHVERLLPRYFQEAYDPALTRATEGLYDDAAAGFRLIYKAGVDHVPSWSWIEDGAHYNRALREFLERVFLDVRDEESIKYIRPTIATLHRDLSLIIDEPRFQLATLERLAQLHKSSLPKDPLNNLTKVKMTPWAYESGGTLLTLINHYFALGGLPQIDQKSCERAVDMVSFYIEQLRMLPEAMLRKLTRRWAGVLAYSPTHAFLINTGTASMQAALDSTEYTYTWIQQNWLEPQMRFWQQCLLSPGVLLDHLMDSWTGSLPAAIQPIAQLAGHGFSRQITPDELVRQVEQALPQDRRQQKLRLMLISRLEQTLYHSLPLMAPEVALSRVAAALSLPPTMPDDPWQLVTAKGRLRWAIGELWGQQRTFSRREVVETLRAQGLMAPPPLLFADTNWPFYLFGLVAGPAGREPELWRVDPLGIDGQPMAEWHHLLQQGNDQPWGILNNPNEYLNRASHHFARHFGLRS